MIATRGGDSEAFALLYERYQVLVFRIGKQMLTDDGSAEDIVQSVFMSLWLAPPQRLTTSLGAWLTVVTKNRARDALRARASRSEVHWPDHLVATEAFDESVFQRLEHVRVRSALAALPFLQRSLIELGFYGERTNAELAELTQVPLGTVKTRIRSGLQKLRGTLRVGVSLPS